MTAVVQMDEIEVKRVSVKATVPDNDLARLMYYLACVCRVIDCGDDADIQRLISYTNWYRLSVAEQKVLVTLCYTINPDVLKDKVFFQLDALCIDFPNEFYEINQVRNRLVVAQSIAIAGRTRRVNKIMVYKQEWLRNFYIDPMRRLAPMFSNSPSSAVTYQQSNTTYQRSNTTYKPTTYEQPVVVRSSNSNKSKYICCCICCFLLFIVPTIIGIIIAIVRSKK